MRAREVVCPTWLLYWRYCRKLRYKDISEMCGFSVDLIRRRCQEYNIPGVRERGRKERYFQLGVGPEREFIPAELLAYEMALRQGLAVEKIAREHNREIEFVEEKLVKIINRKGDAANVAGRI